MCTCAHILFFLKARRAVMGPAKRGPIWAGSGTQPINAHPFGVCIWVPQRGTHYRSRFIFSFFVSHVHSPSARSRLQWAPFGCPYAPPKGWCIISRDLFSFFVSHVHSPSARSRLQWAPFGCPYVHPSGAHYYAHALQHVQKFTFGDNPFGVNFGQNYRDLGHFVRVTFYGQITGTLRGTHMGTLRVPTSFRQFSFLSHRPHFVGLNGHPCGAPIWVPFGHPFLGSTS